MNGYGKELILDLHYCDSSTYDSREKLEKFFAQLCHLIDMQREDLHFWDYDGLPEEYEAAPDHLKGISAVQFIKTSNVTIHTLDTMRCVYLNIFSCKDFNGDIAARFCADYFKGTIVTKAIIERE